MENHDHTEPQLVRAQTSRRARWRVYPGPVGRGACLAADDPAGGLRFIAPPGIALQLPEEAGPMQRWRTARWEFGAPQDGVSQLSLKEVEDLAPAHRAWIREQVREAERLDAMLARARGGSAEPVPIPATAVSISVSAFTASTAVSVAASVLPDRRRVAVVTHSASTYSALTHRLPVSSAVAQVEALVARAVSASHLAAELDTVALSIGQPAVRELVASLLHARSRSHSWRYTRLLGRVERRSARERQITRLVDRSQNARELLNRLEAEKLSEPELHETLMNLLYAQNHGLRWKVTYPLRRALGSPRLGAWRAVLRRQVQPHFAALRPKRSPRMEALPPAHP
jgi:hypothetical protein